MKLSAIVAVLAILLAPLFSRADDKAYTVLIERPHKVGDKVSYELVYALDDTGTYDTSSAKPTTQEVTSGAHLIVDCEILEVDNRGRTTVEESTIRTFSRIEKDKETPILQPGQKIRGMVWEPETKFTIDGKPTTKPVSQLLDRFLHITPLDRVSPDEICGSSIPRHVGDSWPVNADRMAANILAAGYGVDPKNISGTARLTSVETYENQPCIRLQADYTVKHTMPTSEDAKKEAAQNTGWKLEDSDRTYQMVWMLPIDLTKRALFTSNERTSENHRTESRGGRTIDLDQTANTEWDYRILDRQTP